VKSFFGQGGIIYINNQISTELDLVASDGTGAYQTKNRSDQLINYAIGVEQKCRTEAIGLILQLKGSTFVLRY
jgi:hypothetical protein